jgi:hypothetical protein
MRCSFLRGTDRPKRLRLGGANYSEDAPDRWNLGSGAHENSSSLV